MRLHQVINEAVSDVLYHSTYARELLSILKNNQFRLTPSIGTNTEQELALGQNQNIKVGDTVYIHPHHTGTPEVPYKVVSLEYNDNVVIKAIDGDKIDVLKPSILIKDFRQERKKSRKKIYYMSLSRSKVDDYRIKDLSPSANGHSTMVIDGRKLKQDGHTGKPVDYWGDAWRRSNTGTPIKDEMEDRIFSSDSHIDNADKYIKEIHVYLGNNPDPRDIKRIRNIYIESKKKGIPIYVYDEERDYMLLTKRQSGMDVLKRSGQTARTIEYPQRNIFAPYIELLVKDDYDDLSTRAKRELGNIYGIDGLTSLRTDIHNTKKDSSMRPMLDRFIDQLKARDIYSLDEFGRYLMKKFS